MSSWPKITVVTPSYNQGRFIEQTIQSVLGQDYPNLEYIVIDGGSTDGTVDILKRYDEQLAYWVSEKDAGPADAIAKGFARANGSILAYLNSDDVYLPGALKTVAEAMNDSRADVVYGNTYWMDSDGKTIGERRQTPFVPLGYMYGGFDLQQPATFWRKYLYNNCGGIDPSYTFAFDTELFVRFVKQGARFKHVNRFLAGFRIHPESKSSTQLEACESELRRLREHHLFLPYYSRPAIAVRMYARVRRTLSYVLQGDLMWLLGRIPDRIRSRRSHEIVGPRARWM